MSTNAIRTLDGQAYIGPLPSTIVEMIRTTFKADDLGKTWRDMQRPQVSTKPRRKLVARQ
jgi:hypothetical protein